MQCRIPAAWCAPISVALRIYGIYMPNLLRKVPYWEALIAALAGRSLQAEALAIGDFNTCRAYVDEPGAIDVCRPLHG